MENEYIIQFILDNGTFQNFSPKVKGKLIDVNTKIFTNPDLVKNSPEKNGYICILLLELGALKVLREKLIAR